MESMREVGKLVATGAAVCALMFFGVLLLFPDSSQAESPSSGDAYCAGACAPYWAKRKSCPPLPYTDKTGSGITTCACEPNPPAKCKGTGFNTPGGSMKSTGQLGDFLAKTFGEVLKALLQPKPAGGAQPAGGVPLAQQHPPCVVNPATKTISPIPCQEASGAINYGGTSETGIPSASGLGGSTSELLLNALGGGSGLGDVGKNTNVSDILNQQGIKTESEENPANTAATTEMTEAQLTLALQQQGLTPDDAKNTAKALLQGDVAIGESGATIYVRSRDPSSNTEVVGFYGGSTFTPRQSQSLIGRLCASRPWASGLVSAIVSPTFFDGLCQRVGYQVGELVLNPSSPTAGGVKSTTITITQPKTQRATTTTAAVQPEVDIWADPPNVRLGTRTYIFWNTRGVTSCKESGPNFSQATLSGGAATVPISDASTFTIECQTADGQILTDSVRVNLAI